MDFCLRGTKSSFKGGGVFNDYVILMLSSLITAVTKIILLRETNLGPFIFITVKIILFYILQM